MGFGIGDGHVLGGGAGRRVRPLLALVVTLSVSSLAACGGGGGGGTGTMSTREPTPGGSVVFAAEQWSQCVNPITSCAQASWAHWAVFDHVRPKAMTLDAEGNWIPSPLLAEPPTLENGGIVEDPFTITFRLNPDAVWEDGTPITWQDFDFTWRAIMNTTGSLTTTGFENITSVEGPEPNTVVIRFSEVYVDWPDLFGGPTQGVIKKAAFPNADPEAPDLRTEMTTALPFSGGPWVLESWSREQAVLVRNEAFWGERALFDRVIFVPREEQTTEINALLSGEVSAIFPQPANVSILRQVQANRNVSVESGPGAFYEALWLNVERPPLDDVRVRRALIHAIDREALVEQVVRLNHPDAEVLNCGLLSFVNIGFWCDGPEGKPFESYSYDPRRAIGILESAGYDCSAVASGGYCRRNGQDLAIEYSTTAGNARRETTQALLIPQAQAAGIRLVARNYQATDLFSNISPKGEYSIADYAWGGSLDPAVGMLLLCNSIPLEANGWSGQNTSRWCNPEADALISAADQELEPETRRALLRQLYAIQAEEMVLIPLYQLPQVTAWRADRLAGPVGIFNDSPLSGFANMHEWYCATETACR